MKVVLIPAYEPDKVLVEIVDQLASDGLTLVVVDDGSGPRYADVFAAVAKKAHVVTLERNCGKGAALKAGMRYIRESLPACTAFITCDADGQHRPADVLRVKELLDKGEHFVLTVRERKGKIPFRSRFGNDLSRIVYTLLTNRYLSDNQSGLRGFSACHLDWMIEVERNNYDYEMNVLYYAAKMGLKITTMPIDAIYIENNASSHFSPVKDTVRIYKSLFSLAKGSLFAWLTAELLVLILGILLDDRYISFIVPSAGAISLLVCILLNRFFFLKHVPIGGGALVTVAYTIISYFVYTLMCLLLCVTFPSLSLFAAFNIAYLVCIPLRFFLHQLIFIASITKK